MIVQQKKRKRQIKEIKNRKKEKETNKEKENKETQHGLIQKANLARTILDNLAFISNQAQSIQYFITEIIINILKTFKTSKQLRQCTV